MSSHDEPETKQVGVQTFLLSKKRLKPINTIDLKHTFEKVGSTGFVIADPACIVYEGFETMKLNIKKLKVINNSTKAQRVNILPPASPFFRVHFNKKGSLAPGIPEEIAVHFAPNEYRYYYDVIRIHTEDENLMVPIHAYPVMNRDNPKGIFPKLIDFGICVLGTRNVKQIPIDCKIPLNFEFEFKLISPEGGHPDIRIMPMKGIVPGRGSVEVDIEYAPTKPETAVVDFEMNLSQFGFEPIQVRIMGSAQYADVVNQRKVKEEAQLKKALEEKEMKKKKHAFRLRSTKGRNKSQIIKKEDVKEDLNRSYDVETQKIEDLEEGVTRVR